MSTELTAYAKAMELVEAAINVLDEASVCPDDLVDAIGKLHTQLKADIEEGAV